LAGEYEIMKRIVEASPHLTARIAAAFYVIVFVTGIFSLFVRSGVGYAASLIAGVFYIAVTVLFYFIFKPVNRNLSLLAAILSLVGIIFGPLSLFVHALSYISPLVFFGFYCLLIGYLILKSTFLPRFLGVLMLFAGLGWLTFLWQAFALSIAPYIFLPGIIGEGMLTLWLLVFGVDEGRWKEQAWQRPKSEVTFDLSQP
jgi:intracellular septation protein A